MNPEYALHYASHAEIARRYKELKRRRKKATVIGTVACLGMAQFFAISIFFLKGDPLQGSGVIKGHYYFSEKDHTRLEVTREKFWFGRCSGILFVTSFLCALSQE